MKSFWAGSTAQKMMPIRIGAAQASDFAAKAEKRKNAINQYCWLSDKNWYVDVDLQGQPSKQITLAGVAPLQH
ncbi:MAG: hypothetical protein JO170_19000 [Verrucomicrobia bacterium]|nr:hypothetical protein [Verrucomicrobiota bacterium]